MSILPTGRDPLLDLIVSGLAPYIGANMARAAVDAQVEKLRLRGALGSDDIDRLLAAIEPGLAVFVGRQKTAQIGAEIRSALAPARLAARASDPAAPPRRARDAVSVPPGSRTSAGSTPSGKPRPRSS